MPEPDRELPRPVLALHADGQIEVNVSSREQLDEAAVRLLTAIARAIYDGPRVEPPSAP